jgi:transposase-like protein
VIDLFWDSFVATAATKVAPSSLRKHTRQFKVEAVRQVVEKGRSVAEVTDGLGINREGAARVRKG